MSNAYTQIISGLAESITTWDSGQYFTATAHLPYKAWNPNGSPDLDGDERKAVGDAVKESYQSGGREVPQFRGYENPSWQLVRDGASQKWSLSLKLTMDVSDVKLGHQMFTASRSAERANMCKECNEREG